MSSVADCWDHYTRHHLQQTCDFYGATRRWKPVEAWFGAMDPEALTHMEVDGYIAQRAVKAATINRELSLLKSCLKHAERHGLIKRMPYIKSIPGVRPKPRALSEAEVARLMAEADKGGWREQVFVRLALGTGARPGAICDLTWDRAKDVLDLRSDSPLSHRMKRRAVVPINRIVKEALRIAWQHKCCDYVLHVAGRRLSKPHDMIAALAKRAKIKGCTPHVLRHTVASFLIAKGEDLIKVSRLLGHASTDITEKVYVRTTPPWLKKTTDLLDF